MIKDYEEEVGYILVKTDKFNARSFIEIGRYYQRLVNTVEGYELRPAVQIVEALEGMKELNELFQKVYGSDQEVVLIIGFKDEKEKYRKTIRHQLEDILLQ